MALVRLSPLSSAPMNVPRLSLAPALAFGLWACGGAVTQELPVVAPEPAPAPLEMLSEPEPAPPEPDSGEDIQARALDACQSADERIAAGDVAGAIALADKAYSLLLLLPDADENAQAKQDIRLLAAQVVSRAYGASARAPQARTSEDGALPIVHNEHVEREIKSFTTTEREQFLEAYRRSGRYRPMILQKLQEAGLPSQLSWLPLVESLFKVNALSHASALGLWQFIASTGVRYGLKRDDWSDDRLDPVRSTDAAVAYLTELHRLFGDWQKALAAYNCGESRIQRLQKRSETDYLDFWDLYLLLPHETRRYVPRLLAVVKLIENPAAYGLELPELDPPLEEAELVAVERAVKLDAVDVALALSPGTLAALNPALRHGATPSGRYELRVPVGKGELTLAAVAGLAVYAPPKPKYVVHRVRSGETLSTIADHYRTSISLIMRFNNLRSANRIWPGQKLRIPSRG